MYRERERIGIPPRDTTDSVGTIRGLLMFMDHADTASPQLQGSGTLAYTGTLYFHSSTYATVFQVPGGTADGNADLGQHTRRPVTA